MRITFIVITVISLFIAFVLFFTSYRSAFEADQACHFEKRNIYQDKAEFGCDHDLETHQWILFETGLNDRPAMVVKRFRY